MNSEESITERSYMVALDSGHRVVPGHQLHLRHLYKDKSAPAVLMLHGLLEDGTIFYSRAGQGLAYYLVEQGYQVFIPDLRGKGRSWPSVSQLLQYRVVDIITEDLPAIFTHIQDTIAKSPSFLVGHGFGGVLLTSFLARYPEYRHSITGVVHFGARRVATHTNIYRKIFIDWIWSNLAGLLARIRGVVPGRFLHIGSEDEHPNLREDSLAWLNGSDWLDPQDDFNYGKALSTGLEYPPSLYFASQSDLGYGSPRDVRDFMREVGSHNGRLVILGKKEGNLHNYSHIGMLIHPDCADDHFPFMLEWLAEMLDLKAEAQSSDEPNGPKPETQGQDKESRGP